MISREEMKKIVKAAKANTIPPIKVETVEQAELMTNADPVGHVWTVGEEYYVVAQNQKTAA